MWELVVDESENRQTDKGGRRGYGPDVKLQGCSVSMNSRRNTVSGSD